MSKNMKLICKEIQKGENLDSNIPQFFNRLVTLYDQYAELKFTMHYYTFYENYVESGEERSEEEEKLLWDMNRILKEVLSNSFTGDRMEESIKGLDAIRSRIINRMKILTAYTDIFQVFEYIFNRTEYKFRTDLTDIDDEEFLTQVMSYIFDTKDNVIINEKIKEVIGQLPVRLTKARYLDLVRDSLSIYKGADRSSLDSYLYMIKTGAMLYEQEEMNTAYPELFSLKKELEELDYKNLTSEEHTAFTEKIDGAAYQINSLVDFYYGLQECVNHLYVMLILAPYSYMEGYRIESMEGEMKFLLMPADHENCKKLMEAVNGHFTADKRLPLGQEEEDMLKYTEGKQELIAEEFVILEAYFFDIKSNHVKLVDSLMLGHLYNCLNTAQNLLGSSLFVEQDQVINEQKVDEAYLMKVRDDLILKLTEEFKNNSKYVNRALMANTINKMPVFFDSSQDVRDYIKGTLDQCHDLAEKIACVNIIKSFYEN